MVNQGDAELTALLERNGYSILDELGRGGMGVVLLARQQSLGREVAIKCLLPDATVDVAFWRRFKAESSAFRDLSHPNVVRVFDVHLERPNPYLVLEYVRGHGPLDVLLAKRCLPEERRLNIAIGVLRAVEHIHAKQIIHRDLKPGNVLIDSQWDAKLIDFGLARCLTSDQTRATKDGQIIGTLSYMAPEQFAATDPTMATDIYAWGLLAYEILAGSLVFSGLAKDPVSPPLRLRGRIPPLSRYRRDIDPRVERIVMRCLELSPEQRPSGATEVLEQLNFPNRSGDVTAPVAADFLKSVDAPAPRVRSPKPITTPRTPTRMTAYAVRVASILAVLVAAKLLNWVPQTSERNPTPVSTGRQEPPAPSVDSRPSRLNNLLTVLRPLDLPQLLRRAQDLSRASARTGRPSSKAIGVLPAGAQAALRGVGNDLAASLPVMSQTSLQLELLERLYALELLDVYMAAHGQDPPSGVDALMPRGWAETVHLNDVRDPAWPRHRFGRLGTESHPLPGVSSALSGAKLDLETVTPFPQWDVIQWTMTYSSGKQTPQLFSDTRPKRPSTAILEFVLPERLARRRMAMWMVDASTDGTVVLWLDVNDRLRFPLCRKGPPVPQRGPDVPTHVRVTPGTVLRAGRNVVKLSSEPFPGHDHASSQYVGYIALVLFDREAP